MKMTLLPRSREILFGTFIALFTIVSSRAAEDVIISQFNNAGSLAGWRFDYGGVTRTFEFDPTQDAATNPASGSLKMVFGFNAATLNPSGQNKGAMTIDLPTPLDGSAFLTMEMDIRIEPGSATDSSGNSGYFKMVIRNTDTYQFNSQFGDNVTTNSGWRHISVPPSGNRERIRAITVELFGGAAITGPVTFYIDNIKFTRPPTASDVFITRFDDEDVSGWRFDYGGVNPSLIEYSASQDASNNPASGSLKLTFGFDGSSSDNKGAITLDLPGPLNGSSYLSMELDLKIDPSSAAEPSGNSGNLQMIVRNTDTYEPISQFSGSVSSNGGWRHIRAAPLTPPVNEIWGITLEFSAGPELSGPVIFYVDNIKFTEPVAPPPGPTMTIEKPTPGLNLIPISGQHQRQNIATVNNTGYTWVGEPDPVTYSMTIGAYPAGSGFQTHIFLVPGAPTISDPDYFEPHVIFLDIQRQGNGSAFAAFRYKINEPEGNDFLYGAGTLGGVSSTLATGTWSLTFNQNTNVTVTAPDNTQGNFILPPAAAALFADPLTVYAGVQPNAGANVGRIAVLNRFQIVKGSSAVLDDNFLTAQALDPAIWRVAAGDPSGVQLIGADAAFWLLWTIPDSGFGLQTTTDVTNPASWSPLPWVATQMGSVKRILVHSYTDTPEPGKNYAPSPNHSFFRMIDP